MKSFTEPNAFLWRLLTGLTLVDVPLGVASERTSLVRLLAESQEFSGSGPLGGFKGQGGYP